MARFKIPIHHRLKKAATPKSFGTILGVLALLFGLWALSRSCTPQESLKEHVYKIARDNTWSPLPLMGHEQYMTGFTTDLLVAIAKEEEFKLEILTSGPSQLFDNLERGHYDGVLSNLKPSISNKEKYVFSQLFYLTGPVLVVPISSTITNILDLKGKTIGVKEGSATVFTLSALNFINLITYDNMITALEQLNRNKLDGVIMDSVQAYSYLSYYSNKLKVITSPLTDEGLRLVANRDHFGEHLVEMFDHGLEKLKTKKIYQDLLKKWDLINPEIPTVQEPNIVP